MSLCLHLWKLSIYISTNMEHIGIKEHGQRKRIPLFDLAKYVAITLVVIGHSYHLTIGYSSKLLPIIYSFHMPLFMMISGFFSVNSYSRPFIPLVKRKAIQLLLPVISCTVLSCLLLYIWGEKGFFRDEIVGGIWFLKVLFMCYIIVFLTLKICGRKIILGGLLSCCLLFVIPGGGTLKLNLMLLFFWTGYFLNRYFDYINPNLGKTSLGAGFIFVVLCFFGYATFEEKITLEYIITFPIDFTACYLVGLTGSLFTLGLCKLYMKHFSGKKTKLLLKTGQYTLGIYIVQIILVERILDHYCDLNMDFLSNNIIDFIATPLIGIILTFVCYYIVQIFKRNKYINLLLLGNGT